MEIHVISGSMAVKYQKVNMKKEEGIEEFLEKYPEILGKDIFIIGRQVITDTGGRIDLMGMDKKGNLAIVEIKKGTSTRNVVSQILEYGVWAEKIQYDGLNKIAKDKHLEGYPDLYQKFERDFHSIPDPFNDYQRLYIVAEKIDEKIADVSRYLSEGGIDIKCMELNFYENGEQKIIQTNLVVGGEADSEVRGERSSFAKIPWNDRLESATQASREAVCELIAKIEQQFNVKGYPKEAHYRIKAKKDNKKNLFCCMWLTKDTATISFRIDPEKFEYDDDSEVKIVKGRFFPQSTEGRIYIKKSNFDLILRCLVHSYSVTTGSE